MLSGIQTLYRLKLHCDIGKQVKLNPEAREYRPKRATAVKGAKSIQGIHSYQDNGE